MRRLGAWAMLSTCNIYMIVGESLNIIFQTSAGPIITSIISGDRPFPQDQRNGFNSRDECFPFPERAQRHHPSHLLSVPIVHKWSAPLRRRVCSPIVGAYSVSDKDKIMTTSAMSKKTWEEENASRARKTKKTIKQVSIVSREGQAILGACWKSLMIH
jgi:hypothetical protein